VGAHLVAEDRQSGPSEMEFASRSLRSTVVAIEGGKVTSLNASENAIGDHGAERVALALAGNRALVALHLSDNGIRDAGAELIAEALEGNCTLTALHLSRNSIGPHGAAKLAAVLASGALAELDLSDNRLGDAGAVALAGALEPTARLETLDLRVNSVGDEGAESLALVLARNAALTALHLRDNCIGDAGAERIAEALQDNTHLTTLDLSYNHRLSRKGAQRMIAALEASFSLMTLHLRHNKSDPEDEARLQAALKDRRRVRVLTVWYPAVADAPTSVGGPAVVCTNMAGEQVAALEADPPGGPAALHSALAEQLGPAASPFRLVLPDGKPLEALLPPEANSQI